MRAASSRRPPRICRKRSGLRKGTSCCAPCAASWPKLDFACAMQGLNANLLNCSGMMKKNEIERLRRHFPAGTRVELIGMADEPYAPPSGTKGTVKGVDDAGDLQMRWDTGSGLKLIPGVDRFKNVCPKCGNGYDGYPALSRIDGSDICVSISKENRSKQRTFCLLRIICLSVDKHLVSSKFSLQVRNFKNFSVSEVKLCII